LNKALYIKLLKIQWLSARKVIPFPAGKGRWNFPKSTRNEIINNKILIILLLFIYFLNMKYLICLIYFLFSNTYTRRHPEPRIPPDSRSVQILYRISGMLNESYRSHIGDGTFHNSLRWYKWESSVPGKFFMND